MNSSTLKSDDQRFILHKEVKNDYVSECLNFDKFLTKPYDLHKECLKGYGLK